MGANSPQEKKVRKFKNLASKEANFVNLFLGNLAIGCPLHQKIILIFSFLQHSVSFQVYRRYLFPQLASYCIL